MRYTVVPNIHSTPVFLKQTDFEISIQNEKSKKNRTLFKKKKRREEYLKHGEKVYGNRLESQRKSTQVADFHFVVGFYVLSIGLVVVSIIFRALMR
jgi:hypothetical protein